MPSTGRELGTKLSRLILIRLNFRAHRNGDQLTHYFCLFIVGGAGSSCAGTQFWRAGPLLVTLRGLLIAVATLVAGLALRRAGTVVVTHGLSCLMVSRWTRNQTHVLNIGTQILNY